MFASYPFTGNCLQRVKGGKKQFDKIAAPEQVFNPSNKENSRPIPLFNTLAGIKGENSVTWVAVLYPNKTEIIGVCDGMPLTWQSRFGFITVFCNTFFISTLISSHPLLSPYISSFQTVGCIGALWIISPKLTMVMCVVIPVIIGVGSLMGSGLRKMSRAAQAQVTTFFVLLFRHFFFFDTVYLDEF